MIRFIVQRDSKPKIHAQKLIQPGVQAVVGVVQDEWEQPDDESAADRKAVPK